MKTIKAQTSLEALSWLSIAALMAVASAAVFAEGLSSARESRANAELAAALTDLFGAMDSMNEGSVRMLEMRIPEGVEDVRISTNSYGESNLSFGFRDTNYTRILPYAAVFASPNLLHSPGERLVRVEKRAGTVIVSVVGGEND